VTALSFSVSEMNNCHILILKSLLSTRRLTLLVCGIPQVALKTLIVIHRILREGDPTFREELLNYSHRGHVLQISNFKDDSSPLGKFCICLCTCY